MVQFFGQIISDVSGSHVMLLVMMFFIWMEKSLAVSMCVYREATGGRNK